MWTQVMREQYGATEGAANPSTLPASQHGDQLFTPSDVRSALHRRKLGKATARGTPCVEMARLAEDVLAPHLCPKWNAIASAATMPLE